jgi:hypothetical protein
MRRLFPVVSRALVPGMLSGTLLAHLVVAFVVTQLDAIIDWGAVRARIAGAPGWVPGALALIVSALWALVISGAVRGVLARARFLGPLPLTPLQRAAVVLPAIGVAAGWPMAAGLLLPSPIWCVSAGLWTAAIAILVATRRPAAAVLGLVCLGGAPASLLLFPLVLPAVGRPLDRPVAASRPFSVPFRPRGPVQALVWRDLLLLARRFPVALAASAAYAAPAWAVGRGLSVDPQGSTPYLLVTLGFAALLAAGALGRVAVALGPQLDPPSWPVSARERVAAFALSGLVLLGPTLMVLPLRTAITAPAFVAGIALALTRRDGVGGLLWGVIALCTLGSLPFAPVTLGIFTVGALGLAAARVERSRRC